MATGVNVKMGVSGVAQFKASMKESQAAVKNLDQQLKLNEEQLKSSGDAELYLQNKAKILQDQIEKQTEVVRASESALAAMKKNGVSETSTAFQNMQAQMYKATTDLISMRNQLDGVSGSGQDAANGVSEMNNQLKRVGDGVSWQNVTEGLSSITAGLENAAKKAIELGKKIFNATVDAAGWADNLATQAAYYEMTPEALQRAQYTAKLIDTNVEAIVGAQRKLRKGIGSADKGVMGAFAELFGEGYDPRTKGWEDAFWDAGDAIMKFSNAEQKEVYAQKLFGKSWSELIPLFEAGREEYEAMNDSWNVVSDDNLEKLTAFDDQYQKMTSELETLKMTLMSSFAEGLTPALEALTKLMDKFNEYLASPEGKEMLDNLGESVRSLFEELSNVDPEQAMETLKGVIEGIGQALNWFIKNKDSVYTALKVIAGGFALLKITELASNIGRVVDGLRGLTGGGGTPATPTVTPTSNAAPAAASGAAAAGGTGWLSGIWTGIKSAAGTALQTAAFAAPIALFIDGVIRDQQMIAEALEKGKKSQEEYQQTAQELAGTDLFSIWKVMKDYTTINGAGNSADTAEMQSFAQKWLEWFNDPEAENDQYLELWSKLNDEGILDDFNTSMEDLLNNTAHYSDEEINAFYDPIMRALELIEQDNDKQNEITSADLSAFNKVPGEMSSAVANAVSGIKVIMDGETVGSLVAPYVSQSIANGIQ